MSMYLFDEQPIVANKTLAREIGLNEALILQQINYWIEINKKSGNNPIMPPSFSAAKLSGSPASLSASAFPIPSGLPPLRSTSSLQ